MFDGKLTESSLRNAQKFLGIDNGADRVLTVIFRVVYVIFTKLPVVLASSIP